MNSHIRTWRQFVKKVRNKNTKLLPKLSEFKNSILVAGCQRSGTTILTHVFLQSSGVVDYRYGRDSELDGALILSGNFPFGLRHGRYCFQTTYLDERFYEYYEHLGEFKLIYIIRNPFSVVYSMCYHWKRKLNIRNNALNRLFNNCGKKGLTENERKYFDLFGTLGITNLRKACLSYVGKTSQVFDLVKKIKKDIMVIEYDDLVQKKESLLPLIYSFVELPYDENYAHLINSESLRKADNLSNTEKKQIRESCWDVYVRARDLAVVPCSDKYSH